MLFQGLRGVHTIMGLIRKFTIATGALLTLGGGGLSYSTINDIKTDPGFPAATQCRDLMKKGQACSAEGTKELVEAYEKVSGAGIFGAAGFLGTTLLTLGAVAGSRRKKKVGI